MRKSVRRTYNTVCPICGGDVLTYQRATCGKPDCVTQQMRLSGSKGGYATAKIMRIRSQKFMILPAWKR